MLQAYKQLAAAITIPHDTVGLPNVAADQKTLDSVLNAVFVAIGAVAVLIIILAAFAYITSGGNPGKAKQAKDAILYAVIGIIVTLVAFSIVQFVVGQF